MIRGFYVNAYALPGGGGQTFGCSEFGHRTTFHNAERFVSHEPIFTARLASSACAASAIAAGPASANTTGSALA